MAWLNLFDGAKQQQIRRLADQIARDCLATVFQDACRKAARMTPAEARGYFRAWAAEPVRSRAGALMVERGMRYDLFDALVESATERLVDLATQLAIGPISSSAA